MPNLAKFLIGLAATLLMGWLWHGPLGNGARFVDSVEQQAKAAVAGTGLPGIDVRLGRDPLSRTATLSGPANDFQRNGMGNEPGLTEIVAATKGVGSVHWADEGKTGGGIPLLAETLILLLISYLIGLGAGRLLSGRRKRTSYLD